VEHKSLLNRPGICDGIICCNGFVCLYSRFEYKNSIQFGKNTFIIPSYAVDSVKRYFFVVHVIVFGRLKYIPRLFSEYMLTFMFEEPMKICGAN